MQTGHVSKGFTLTELLISLAIVLLIASAGLPALQRLLENQRASNDVRVLYALFSDAHSHAVLHDRAVSLCPLDDSNECCPEWMDEISVFEDSNDNRILDDDERVLRRIPAVSDDRISRQYPGRRAVTFSPAGDSLGFNGTLRYKLEGLSTHSASIVIHGTGRVRMGARERY